MNNTLKKCKTQTLNHIHRIQGQLRKLEEIVNNESDCTQIAHLTTSVAKSFDSLRAKTLEGYILQNMIDPDQQETAYHQLKTILNLYKK